MNNAMKFKSDLLVDWEHPRKFLCSVELELHNVFPIREISTRKDYALGVKLLERLMDKKENYSGLEFRAINAYMKELVGIIKKYEDVEFVATEKITLSILIKDLLEINELSRRDLESLFGDKTMVSRYLNGKIKMNEDHIRGLSKLLNCSTDLILGLGEKAA